jgi:hypothetical protein
LRGAHGFFLNLGKVAISNIPAMPFAEGVGGGQVCRFPFLNLLCFSLFRFQSAFMASLAKSNWLVRLIPVLERGHKTNILAMTSRAHTVMPAIKLECSMAV